MTDKVVERLFETLNRRNAADVAQLYTEDALIVGQSDEPLKGRKAITDNYNAYFRAYPDFSIELKSSLGSGKLVCGEAVFRGTHTGPLESPDGDIDPTGRKVEVPVAGFFDVTPDGLISEDRTYFDTAIMMTQLGLS